MRIKNPHWEAYLENGGHVLGRDPKPKNVTHKCVSCGKHINKKEIFVANDAGNRFHFSCIMRSQEYHDEAGR